MRTSMTVITLAAGALALLSCIIPTAVAVAEEREPMSAFETVVAAHLPYYEAWFDNSALSPEVVEDIIEVQQIILNTAGHMNNGQHPAAIDLLLLSDDWSDLMYWAYQGSEEAIYVISLLASNTVTVDGEEILKPQLVPYLQSMVFHGTQIDGFFNQGSSLEHDVLHLHYLLVQIVMDQGVEYNFPAAYEDSGDFQAVLTQMGNDIGFDLIELNLDWDYEVDFDSIFPDPADTGLQSPVLSSDTYYSDPYYSGVLVFRERR